MRPTSTTRSLAAMVVLVCAGLPGTALATAPTQTQILTPTVPQTYAMFDHIDGAAAPTLAVSGTSDGTTGTVKVACWRRDPAGVPARTGESAAVAVGGDGTFSGTITPEVMSDCPGTLRAVPVGVTIATQND